MRFRAYLLLACFALAAVDAIAQDTSPVADSAQLPTAEAPSPPDKLNTLHVYTNLLQFAVLAVDPRLAPLPSLTPAEVNLTLDRGPIFHPVKLRVEGDDPLSIAVLIDASGGQRQLTRTLAKAVAGIVSSSLGGRDRISVYAVDCDLVRSLESVPADDGALVLSTTEHLLTLPELHGGKDGAACGKSVPLWDSIATVAQELASNDYGRRVIVIASQGQDGGRHVTVKQLSRYLSAHSIAAFAFRDEAEHVLSNFAGSSLTPSRPSDLNAVLREHQDHAQLLAIEDPLRLLCGSNGGMVFNADAHNAAAQLSYLVDLLRHRYIMEYPRPDKFTPGIHDLQVKISLPNAFAASTGASSPMPDPASAADPNTLPSAHSPAVLGSRHHLP